MLDLEQLAAQKAEFAAQQRIAVLPSEIQAIQRELGARGLLMSGAMLKRVLAACVSALHAQASSVKSEYEWAVSQALFASQAWVERLIVPKFILLGTYSALLLNRT